MSEYFVRFKELADRPEQDTRIKYLFYDLLDLRKRRLSFIIIIIIIIAVR